MQKLTEYVRYFAMILRSIADLKALRLRPMFSGRIVIKGAEQICAITYEIVCDGYFQNSVVPMPSGQSNAASAACQD